MNRSVRYGLLFAVVALVALSVFYANGSLQAASSSTPVAVAGQTLQIFQSSTKDFTTVDANTVSGISYPVSIICPGNMDISSLNFGLSALTITVPYTSSLPVCTSPITTTNGMYGWVVTKEQVVRSYADAANPTFIMTASLGFSGQVYLSGKSYYGTMLMTMKATGPLNNTPSNSGVTCKTLPTDPGCGSKSFSGTWEIISPQGGGELRAVQGSGPISWGGLGTPIVYSGTMSLRYDTFLPFSAK